MVALAKAKTRQPELLATVKEKYAEIKEQDCLFDFSPTITEVIPMYYTFCYTTYMGTLQYLDKCIDNFETKNNVYHPLGYLHYYSGLIRIGYDFISFGSKDADEKLEVMIPIYEKFLEETLIPMAIYEYEKLVEFRLLSFSAVDTFSPTMDDMFESSMSVREFKEKMSSLAVVNAIDGLNATSGTIDDILELLGKATGNKNRSSGSAPDVPKDIDGMFDGS
jgi:hypothetical protein